MSWVGGSLVLCKVLAPAVILASLAGCGLFEPGPSGRTVTAPRPPHAPGFPERDVIGGRDPGGTTPGAGTGTTPSLERACYPGIDADWATCLDLVGLDPVPADYVYPDPLGDSAQYSPPALYLDLDAVDPGTLLAQNFRLDEIATTSRGRFAVVQPHAIARLQAVRDELGALTVNSGYRSPGYNAGIPGSASSSRHTFGDGFDLAPADVSLDALYEACWAHGAGYVGVYATHIHCDWRDDPLDPLFFGFGAAAMVQRTLAPQPVHSARLEWQGGALTAPSVGWDEGEPLRRWWAWDVDGALLTTAEGEHFTPPPGAAEVAVSVGLELELHTYLDV